MKITLASSWWHQVGPFPYIQDNSISVPRMFALLSNKTQDTYNRLFTMIKELLCNVTPATMKLDFGLLVTYKNYSNN